MRKSDELKNPKSCLNRAKEDEMLFVLRGHDIVAPFIIRTWISERIRMRKNKLTDPEIQEAEECARIMEKENAEE